MNLQNVKNYLIFLIAVSHMLYNGYHSDEKITKETKSLRQTTPLEATDSTSVEISTDSLSKRISKAENLPLQGVQQPSRPKYLSPGFLIGNSYTQNFHSN